MQKPQMNKQEVFDTVCRHLAQQGEQSMSDSIGCAYRGSDGARCAVGCLIPDESYDEMSMEGAAADDARILSALPFVSDPEDVRLLCKLQCTHDDLSPHLWPTRFSLIANNFQLDASIIDTLNWRI